MKLLFYLIFSLYSFSYCCQEISGKWYMVNRSGLIEFNFKKDSVTREKLFLNLDPKRGIETRIGFIKRIKQDSLHLLVFKEKEKYKSMVFLSKQPSLLSGLVWNLPDTSFNSIELLTAYYKNIDKALYSWNLYSSAFREELQDKLDPNSMSLDEFKAFLDACFLQQKTEIKEAKKFITAYMGFSTYNH